ncbi:tRNA lysidine(34) synthetase TilS [Thermosulfurimonas sp.]|uniref:tRNA lysidine(34) synthetase TilS n=1 Tax=Thermosulfurimonas sp. TaxID=2080236 RepID=UPI0025E64838|nr:tRNA lysidine(34) synthetase TilS [Thermosulfurimonas sp.]
MRSSLLRKVRQTIERYALFRPGDRVLVAVSGGVDSMVLLEVLHLLQREYGLSLWVAHYDHRLRKSSLEEALWVRQEARRRGLPFIYGVGLVREYARREKISLEMAGRELRYRFFESLRRRLDLQKVALAHHADDLAEEVLLKFIRGAGRRGLAGIPVKREEVVVRPLLLVTRAEIEAFARQRGLRWVEDESNQDPRFWRNRVRHLLLPFLERHFHPRVRENLKRTALILAEEEELIGDLARRAYDRALLETGELSVPVLRELPEALRRRIYWIALKEAGVPLLRIRQGHLQALEQLFRGRARGPVPLPGGFMALRAPGRIRILSGPQPAISPFVLKVQGPGRYPLPGGWYLRVESSPTCPEGLRLKKDFPFIVRSRRPGDRVLIPGLGHKKIKKLLREKGLTVWERDLWPLVEKDGKIIAIPEYYVHPDWRPSPQEEALCLKLERGYKI